MGTCVLLLLAILLVAEPQLRKSTEIVGYPGILAESLLR